MMLTLIPFFDRNMSVSAYSLFTRKNNFLMNPSLLGSRQFDGAAYVDGLELIQELGTTTLSGGKPIFVSLNNISIFSSLESECKNTNHAPILLIDQTFPPVSCIQTASANCANSDIILQSVIFLFTATKTTHRFCHRWTTF